MLDPEPNSGVCPASNPEKQRAITMTDWPLRSYLELGALPGAVPCARLHTKHILWEWGLDSFTNSVELVVSELTTNAIAASAGLSGSRYGGRWSAGTPPLRLWVCADKTRVLVQVWDGDQRLPEPQETDVFAESGRGLILVTSVSEKWGAYAPEGSSGKVVWACVNQAQEEET